MIDATDGPRLPAPNTGALEDVHLGLAFSGGGFRASLFHLGTLQRLAELDLLRHVSVLSTVSGGSVIAGQYMLHLKAALDGSTTGRLSREQYVELIGALRAPFEIGMGRGLRNRLFTDLGMNIRMLLGWPFAFAPTHRLASWDRSLTDRMVQQYQDHLYAPITRRLTRDSRELERGIPLHRMKVLPMELEAKDDFENYQRERDRDCIPRLVLNAACLNTARRFLFTFVEVGDADLGFLRFDECWQVLRYKKLLELAAPHPGRMIRFFDVLRGSDRSRRTWSVAGTRIPEGWERAIEATIATLASTPGAHGASPNAEAGDAGLGVGLRPSAGVHLAWWCAVESLEAQRQLHPSASLSGLAELGGATVESNALKEARAGSGAVDRLCDPWDDALTLRHAPFDLLRRAKIAAWYLRDESGWRDVKGRPVERRDDYTPDEHRERFWGAVREIDPGLAQRLSGGATRPPHEADVFELVLDVYYFRSAEAFAWSAPEALESLTLPKAVGASANFPPVFAPYRLRGLYERSRVKNAALSDGGLNDNQGIETLMDEDCTHVIASDAGAPREADLSVNGNRAGMLGQIIVNSLTIVQYLQLRALRESERVSNAVAPAQVPGGTQDQKKALADLIARYPLAAAAFFQLGSNVSNGISEATQPPPLPPHPLAEHVTPIRTDLDVFGEIERDALIYQGYQLCDRFVRRYVLPRLEERGMGPKTIAPPLAPDPPGVRLEPLTPRAARRAARVLATGSKLAFRFLDENQFAIERPGVWFALNAAWAALFIAAAAVPAGFWVAYLELAPVPHFFAWLGFLGYLAAVTALAVTRWAIPMVFVAVASALLIVPAILVQPPAWRQIAGWLLCTTLLPPLALWAFGWWMRLDGLLARWASRR